MAVQQKPLLAGRLDEKTMSLIRYPVMVSTKLDGIRCLMRGGKAMSRTMKPIPNDQIRAILESSPLAGQHLDGELMSGTSFSEGTGNIMRQAGNPKFVYWVFDLDIVGPFKERFHKLARLVGDNDFPWLHIVEHHVATSEEELISYENEFLRRGYEGIMIRDPNGVYKHGRSTVNEGILLKLKRFEDAEAKIVGVTPLFENDNIAEEDAFGRTKRSTSMDNLIQKDTLGSITVEFDGITFNIGTGMDAETRKTMWIERESLIGKMAKFKYQARGAKEAPRFPVFLGMRAKEDMDNDT